MDPDRRNAGPDLVLSSGMLSLMHTKEFVGKYASLKKVIKKRGSLLIAYSGGVDSALLAAGGRKYPPGQSPNSETDHGQMKGSRI
ncbi:MAG: hypothetical protein LUQ12_00880 [Methanoregulaceae archaeon]|nr:hypothetical protein [Methanoregulaceae archaeon]